MYDELKNIIDNSDNIVFFGGAGVSTESGIPDFRSADGIFNLVDSRTYSPEQVVSHSFFMNNTKFFYDFYKDKMIFPDAQPNYAHKALAKLEKTGKLKAIITQNIDSLHQKAGSENVLELHGTVMRNYCMDCHSFYDVNYILNSKGVPYCEKCGGIVKPDVVLYQEGLDSKTIEKSIHYISTCDVLIIGGTSLIVYPAAGLISYFHGSKIVVINKSPTSRDKEADLLINAPIGQVFSKVVDI